MANTSAQRTGFWVLVATITASSMTFIDGSALNVALTALQQDLKASGVDLLWIINAYLLVLASLILLGGSLGDHFGRNRIFRIGIIIFSAASFVCGVAPTVGVLIAARAVQGIGGALMVPGSLAIISASFPADRRGGAIGTWSSFATITTILAPTLGGILASNGLWRGVFFINIPLALISVYALSHVPETHDATASRSLDYPGTLLIILGLAGITYGTIGLGQSINDRGALAALIGGVIAIVGFVVVEGRSANPMVPLGLFRERTFAGTNLMTLFLYGALSGALFFLPLDLIQVQGYRAEIAGFSLLPFSLMLIVLSPLMGRFVSRFGPRIPLTIGPFIVGIGFLLFSRTGLTNGPADYWTTYLPAIFMFGLGMGITVAPLTTAVMGSVPSHEAGIASGVNNAVTRSAQGLAVAIMGAIALAAFAGDLSTHMAQTPINPDARAQIQASAGKLGSTEIPDALSAADKDAAKQAIRLAFVDMFALITTIGAGLAWLSALAALVLVENRLPQMDRAADPAT